MNLRDRIATLIIVVGAGLGFTVNSSLAHRFNVTLILPASNGMAAEAKAIRQGFMLATTERDGHPNEESDGHLGGLDVYVNIIDEQQLTAGSADQVGADANIVAAMGSDETLSLVTRALDGKSIALLAPGQTPFEKSTVPAVSEFTANYQKAYGAAPDKFAAQGYNAAQRIDRAVQEQEGTDDLAMIRENFANSASDFSW